MKSYILRLRFIILFFAHGLLFLSCAKKELTQVNVEDFQQFVEETQYVTDAELYGWSIVQKSIEEFIVLSGIDWRCPDGINYSKPGQPVTQVSYNDAIAYANWAQKSIPSYEAYWDMTRDDERPINISTSDILPTDQVHTIGNVWEITTPDTYGRIRLAGGSYLCHPNTCNGSDPARELYVDVETGNCHIGFAVY